MVRFISQLSTIPPEFIEIMTVNGFVGNILIGGVSAVNGYLYVPTGIAIGPHVQSKQIFMTVGGGLVIYNLP